MQQIVIYTDGACRKNPGPGGWGAVLRFGAQEREINGSEADTTNNRMELRAAIEALSLLKRPTDVTLYTDSIYLRDGMLRWLKGWKLNQWRTAARAPVKNRDLWERLDALNDTHRIDWRWVKGHAGDAGNERADALANSAIDEALGLA
ncbi:MAG: ribonuclease HI [Gammaproteobacteria bacterium AqS3]|nr:ribonuclease HI [Gammaproteobacteria bacterium AqS3]